MDLTFFEPIADLEGDSLSFDFGPVMPLEALPASEAEATMMTSHSSHSSSQEDDEEANPGPLKRNKRSAASRKRQNEEPPAVEQDEEEGEWIRFEAGTRGENAFAFSKDELLRLTPAMLDTYEEEVRAHHQPSAAETALLKKYRRQVRNRASAQNSRARKRQHAEKLETEVAQLEARCAELEARAQRAENRVRQLEAAQAGGVRPGGGLMLALVLGLGLAGMLLWSGPRHPLLLSSSSSSSSMASSWRRPPVVSSTRRLLEAPVASPAPPASASPPAPPSRRMRIVEEAASRAGSLRLHQEPVPLAWDRPDTAHLYCPAPALLGPAATMSADGAPPDRLALLLPGEALNGTALHMYRDSPLVEVSCSLLDLWPVRVPTNRLSS